MNQQLNEGEMGLPVTGPWRKSTFSDQGDCVELAPTHTGVAMRDSKNPDGPTLHFTRSELRAFLAGAKASEYDDLI